MTSGADLLDGLRLASILARARGRILWHRIAQPRRPVQVALLVILGLAAGAGLVFLVWLPQVAVALAAPSEASRQELAGVVGSVTAVGLFAYLVLLAYGSLLFTLSSLLANDDLQLLLPAPWPVSAVIAARMWLRTGTLFAIALALVFPTLVLLPVVAGAPAAILVALLVLAAYPLLVVAFVGVLVLPLLRLVPPHRAREVIAVLSLLLALGIQVPNLLFNPAYGGGARRSVALLPFLRLGGSRWLPSGWAAQAMTAAFAGRWTESAAWLAVLLVATYLVFTVALRVMSRVYVSGWVSGAAPRRARRAPGTASPRLGAPAWQRLGIGTDIAAVIRRDWLLRRRDIVFLLRIVLPTVAVGFLLIRSLAGGIARLHDIGAGPGPALLAAAPGAFVIFMLSSGLGLPAVSMEGRAVWIYAVSPNSMGRLLLAKYLGTVPAEVALALAAGAVMEVIVAPGVTWALAALLALAVLSACLGTVTVAVGAMFPNFSWTDPRRVASTAAALGGLLAQFVLLPLLAAAIGVPVFISYAAHLAFLPLFVLGFALLAAGGGVAVGVATAVARARLQRLDLNVEAPVGLE